MNRDESLRRQQRVGSSGDHVGSSSGGQQQLGISLSGGSDGTTGQTAHTVAQLQAAAAASQQQQLQQPVQQIVLQNVAIQPNTPTAQLLAHMTPSLQQQGGGSHVQSPNLTSSTSRQALITQSLAPQTVARLLNPTPTSAVRFSPSPCNLAQNLPSAVTNSNAVIRQLSLPAGMMVVPPLSPVRAGLQTAAMVTPTTPTGSLGTTTPLIIQQGTRELQIVRSQQQQQVVATPTSNVSATGGTIHHLGQSPPRGGPPIPPLANPVQSTILTATSMSQQLPQQQQQHQRAADAQELLSQLAQQSKITIPQSQTGQPVERLGSGTSVTPGSAATSSPAVTPSRLPLTERSAFSILTPPNVDMSSVVASPERPRKRIKLEEKPPASQDAAQYRKLICDQKLREMSKIKENYKEHLTELFFLQHGRNFMDYHTWKRRPPVPLLHFLKTAHLDSDDEEEGQEKSINNEVKVITTSGGTTPLATPVAISTTLPPAIAAMQQQGMAVEQSRKPGGRHGMVFGRVQAASNTPVAHRPGGVPLATSAATTTVGSPPPYSTGSTSNGILTTTVSTTSGAGMATATSESSLSRPASAISINPGTPTIPKTAKNPLSPSRQTTRQNAISAVYDSTIGSQEAIVERAKQEAQVIQRVDELRREGMWSSRRLPKVQEPPRNKAHWDYLLEEMQWLAADFAQERKWKKAGARKIARMITRYHQEQQQKEIKAEKEEGLKLKRTAGNMAKMIREFWSNIEKVVQYKQQSRLEEKRKKALDLHLSFIVDQTEKYSSWLTEGLANSTSSHCGSIPSSPGRPGVDDGDFEPKSESDDEETIEKEEKEAGLDEKSTKEEIAALQKESEIPIEDLLSQLPKEVLEKPASLEPSEGEESEVEKKRKREKESDVYHSGEEDSEDNEETVAEQEKHEKKDHSQELADLQNEGEMSMEELYKKYAGAYDSDFEAELSMDEDNETEDETEDSDEEAESELDSDDDEEKEEEEQAEEMGEEVGMDYLMNLDKDESEKKTDGTGPGKDLTDIAAAAQSIQPTGYTLETTQVKTQVPFLLKHKLREYQHVGLDWLATMHERRLNGILADEMGLGKTIQTIALLAHLACEHGVWGPHLIVVPTSVMLNWEMELKKWCPAFKILTYYGNLKERKMKRQGWTKTNAFHVCITSYKLVIQDHQAFRRKKWKYFILDEAQNIKNFKSQRWQTLLNFSSMRRLLLTGTPLQNSLMELWSLMHFLMPHVFASHREFKEWFSNPLTGMVEGSHEYNEGLIRRLHKVLRPFLLRRLKADVEKQMPKKFEHVVMCRLSKRQRFLYDDFMSKAKTKETLETGHFMSVINILMQLRKVCNHPNLFDPRPIMSPFEMEGITYTTASLIMRALEYDPLKHVDLTELYPCLADLELFLPAFAAHRIKKLQAPRKLIEEIDSQPDPPPRLKPVDRPTKFVLRCSSPMPTSSGRTSPFVTIPQRSGSPLTVRTPTARSPVTVVSSATTAVSQASTVLVSPTTVVSSQSSVQAMSQARVTPQQVSAASAVVSEASPATPTTTVTQHNVTSQPITVQIHHTQQGTRLMIPSTQLSQLPGFIQIVQTSSGQHIIAPVSQQPQTVTTQAVVNGPTVTTASTPATLTTATTVTNVTKQVTTVQLPSGPSVTTTVKPVLRVSPLASATTTTTTTDTVIAKPQESLVQTVATSLASGSKPAATSSVSVTTRTAAAKSQASIKQAKQKSVFYLSQLEEAKTRERQNVLKTLAKVNKKNCDVRPVYGQDLSCSVCVLQDTCRDCNRDRWHGQGHVHCYKVHNAKKKSYHPDIYWKTTDALRGWVHTTEQYLAELQDILNRFVFAIPPVRCPCIQMHTSHPPPSVLARDRHLVQTLQRELSPRAASLHRISTNMSVQFPEARLIQYDCGKLQTLDILLRRLKSGQHRVLVFTQMTKMLDVLEAFLNFHGHRYLRLDGTTRVEQRQILMDRFNMDKRIFVFILSTRSGGIGVNLTGADTVIFYDSDWNPTMDAQAQDRCHRIGQTRDVHIYRLISEKTIEENILKKANQKRLLGNVAIEGGNFTTAYFKQQTIIELFEEPSGLDSLVKDKSAKAEPKPVEPKPVEPKPVEPKPVEPLPEPEEKKEPEKEKDVKLTQDQMEQALGAAEDESDLQAAKVVKAEQKAELAEFDESIPWDEREAELRKEQEDESRVEQELALLDKELSPVERLAVAFMETQLAPFNTEELQKAEEEVTIAKEEWELTRLQALKEEEERRAEIEEDEVLFTYSRDDAYNQIYICDETGEHMPIWTPPTPPQDDNDMYTDQTLLFLYEPSVMPESQLPPVYVKKEHKRIRVDPHIGARKHKIRKEEQPRVPRSLFDRPMAILRKDAKLVKMKQQGLIKPLKTHHQSLMSRPFMDQVSDQPEWLIHEDWALLQAVKTLLQLPLSLTTASPAHIANWDLVADVVNATSRIYRSPKQCKNRYENVIVPREEGRILYDINPRKPKKSKGIYKSYFQTKNNRPMKTSQLHAQDNNGALTTLFSLHFDSSKSISTKRTPTFRPAVANPTVKNPKHAAVLAENGISYDQPRTPIQVAAIRAERIAKDKKEQQLRAQQQQQQQQQQAATAVATTQVATVATAVATVAAPVAAQVQPQMTIVQGQQLQQVATVAGTTVVPASALQKTATGATVATVSLARTLGATGSIVVNAAGGVAGNALTAINKRLGQTVVPQSATNTVNSSLAAVRAARAATSQEIAAVVASQGQARITAQGQPAQILTTSSLNTAQLVATQKAAITTVASRLSTIPQQLTQPKTLTAAQLNILRQQALVKQQQQQQQQLQRQARLQAAQSLQGGTAFAVQKTVTTPLITTVAQTQVTQARLQAPRPAVKQPMQEQVAAALLRQRQLQQQKVAAAISGATTQPTVQQMAVSQGQVTRLTTAQIITGTPVHQVAAAGGASSQPVATLVKTVSTQGGSTVPSMTIPVSAVSLGISVSVPQQKGVSGKTTAQQLRNLQIQQLQRKAATVTPAQLQGQQKVAALTGQLQQVTKPLIIPQQQGTTNLPKFIQQIQQHLNRQPQASAPTIQQIITSVPPASQTTTTVIATQIVTQAQPVQTLAKMSVPSGTTTASVPQTVRTSIGGLSAVVSTPTSLVGTQVIGNIGASQSGTIAPTVTLSGTPTPSATLVKHVQEVMVSPQKTIPVQASVAQQIKQVAARQAQAQTQVLTGATAQTPTVAQTVTVQQQLQQPQVTVKQQQPSPGVQAAVQQVVQQAQAQAQAAQRQQAAAGGTASAGATVVVTSAPTVAHVVQPTSSLVQQQTPVHVQTTTVPQIGQQTIVQSQNVTATDPNQQQQARASPYAMRPRNTRTSQNQ